MGKGGKMADKPNKPNKPKGLSEKDIKEINNWKNRVRHRVCRVPISKEDMEKFIHRKPWSRRY